MNAIEEAPSPEATEYSKLTQLQKLAGFLLIMEPDNAARIMGQLDQAELEAVSAEMAKFSAISHDLQNEIMEEFLPVAVQASTAVAGGVDRVKTILEKAVGTFRASDIIGRVSVQRPSVAAMQEILEMDTRALYNVLSHEQLQTMALVASYLPPQKASELLSLVRPELREQLVERLATLSPTSLEVVESVAESLQARLAGNPARALSHTGGVKVAADLLNALPKNLSDSILSSMRERNAELGDAVLRKMLTFEELARLDAKTLQKILQEVDFRSLAVALTTAPAMLKNKFFSSISKRAADNVREEISFLGQVKASEIDAAQMEIIETVRKLESEGTINLDAIRQKS
jgi:flagellar motor switch protein FliG